MADCEEATTIRLSSSPLRHRYLVEQGGGRHVDVGESGEVRQIILVGRQVVNRIDATQQVGHELPVSDISDVELRPRSHVVRLAVSMDWSGERVEHHDVVPELDQAVSRCGSR